MQKILVFAATLAIALVVFRSSFVPQSSESDLNSSTSAEQLNYESYSEGINTVLFDPNGEINYTLRAQRQIQFSEEVTEIQQPFIRLFQDGTPTWNVVAEKGLIAADSSGVETMESNDTIELSGNVEAYSVDNYGNRTVISTESLLVNPATEILSTELAVEMKTELMNQTGIGMFANLKTDELTIHQNIRGSYEKKQNN